jgi:hypothetical protein
LRRTHIVIPVAVFMLLGTPAYAYGDPTGGMLFQVLMPALAAVWGIWLVFANRLRKGFSRLTRKLRGLDTTESPEA